MSGTFARRRDYYAGGLMVLIGLGTVLQARAYPLGSLTHMGPGFFPTILGVVLAGVGLLIAIAAFASPPSEGENILPERPEWRGWLAVIAGPLLFIVLGAYTGLLLATFACVFVSALGDRTSTLKGAFLLAAGVTAFGILLFSYILQVAMPILHWG